MAKLWSLDFNYCQNNRAQWENLRAFLKLLDTKTGYLLFLYIFLFFVLCVYLSIFSVNKFLLTTVNNSFNILFTCRNSPAEEFFRRTVFCGCAANFRGCICGCDFNKVAKRLFWDCASALFFPLWVCFMSGEHLPWTAPLADCFWTEIIYIQYFYFFLIKCTFGDFKVSVLL